MRTAHRVAIGFFLLVSTTVLGGIGQPVSANTYAYAAGTTAVARTGLTGSLVDQGAVVCTGAPDVAVGAGAGGACIPWSAGGSGIEVIDAKNDHAVAFQVCVDNDGNRQCGGTPAIPGCADSIVFSHFDDGSFSNPVAAPTSFASGCPGGFPGWVVFLCQGVHDGSGPHTHEATAGTVKPVGGGGPSGQFCGGPTFVPGKPYFEHLPTGVEDVCVGQGSMSTTSPLFFPGAGSASTASFGASLSGACALGGNLSITGRFNGPVGGAFCGAATGAGITSSGHRFTFVWAGSLMELTPLTPNGASGVFQVIPNTTAGATCVGGATSFIIGGSAVLA